MNGPRAGEALGERIRAIYADALARVDAEVSGYPQPIPACDAQFNHLLEQRRALRRARRGLADAISGGGRALRTEATAACEWLDAAGRAALEEVFDD